ncbi:MAG: CpsD/CapB family tyrosine-protein kinase [Methylovirgula sp.]
MTHAARPAHAKVNSLQMPRANEEGTEATGAGLKDIELNAATLLSKRIISHDTTDPRSKSFDMLRTQVLRSMDIKGWQVLAVTSPSAGCGKTMTAINLALSIARQPERSVLLIDMDLRKPQVASCLGFRGDEHLLGVLEGRTALSDALIEAHVRDQRFMVLPSKPMTSGSAEWMASRAMSKLLLEIKKDYPTCTVILDMPPVLHSDDVIAILPQLDCFLLVVAAGVTTVAQIEECNRHLQSVDILRIVLNKASELVTDDYYY